MGKKQIRVGQLIAPFGPGSLYTDRRGTPHVICGLDFWFMRTDRDGRTSRSESQYEFERFEPRLTDLLKVSRLFSPPDYRSTGRGQTPPPNAWLHTPALRFPSWYRHTKTGEMRQFNLDTLKLDSPPGGGRWLPVRFASVCVDGHLSEFPWKAWIGCQCKGSAGLSLTDRGGSELGSIRIKCRTCPAGSDGSKGKSLSGTTVKPDSAGGTQSAFQRAGIVCPGDRPWLGDAASVAGCNSPLIGALINQTNLYFPKTASAISLPYFGEQSNEVSALRNAIEEDQAACGGALSLWKLAGDDVDRSDIAADMQRKLGRRGVVATEDEVLAALKNLFEGSTRDLSSSKQPSRPESELLSFRRSEFNVLRNEVNDPEGIPNLRVIPTGISEELQPWISRVNLVERLRETRAFYGFDRIEQAQNPLEDLPEKALTQLFRDPPTQPQDSWLPAVETFGEGIYLELDENRLTDWQTEQAAWIEDRIDDAFLVRLAGVFHTNPPLDPATRSWASRYLLVHSFTHILINQLVFECGYSSASLRERLFVSADEKAPMAGTLIYTAAGDSEGTLGGLVRLGRPDRLGPVVRRALSRASWCSADPVCSENLGGQGSRLANLAACHACTLLPETSCETVNQGLDRAMVVGTPTERSGGIMAALLEQVYIFD